MHPTFNAPIGKMCVVVLNSSDEILPDASVIVANIADGKELSATFDSNSKMHYAFNAEQYVNVIVSRDGYEEQQRKINCWPNRKVHYFRLGKPGSQYTYFDGIKWPYYSSEDALGIVFRHPLSSSDGWIS